MSHYDLHALILHDLNKASFNAFFSIQCCRIITYHIYWIILNNSIFTHITRCSNKLYKQQNILLCFLHCALWYYYATWTNKMQSFQINTLIQFLTSSTVLNRPKNEPMRFEKCRRHQKFKNWIEVLIWKVCISLVHVA